MAVNRHAWTDDDGSGIIGTILNNARLQEIYDDIDRMFTTDVQTLGIAWLADNIATPATPTAGKIAIYAKSNALGVKDSSGNEALYGPALSLSGPGPHAIGGVPVSGTVLSLYGAGALLLHPLDLLYGAGNALGLRFTSDGVLLVGTNSTGLAAPGSVVLANNKAYMGLNAGGGYMRLIHIDGADRVRVAADSLTFSPPFIAAASLPSAPLDGAMALDATNNTIVFYSGGARLRVKVASTEAW